MHDLTWQAGLPQSRAAGQLLVADSVAAMSVAPTVCQLVAQRPRRARVFEKWGIPYCCSAGNYPLAQLCAQCGLSLATVQADLQAGDAASCPALGEDDAVEWSQLGLAELIAHIVGVHHAYLRAELPRLSRLINRVAADHGAHFAELWELEGLFEEFEQNAERHMAYEETTLFPLVRQLEQDIHLVPTRTGLVDTSPHLLRVAHLICSLEAEHAAVHDSLDRMRAWTNGFTPPPTACNTYRVMLEGLADLDVDVRRHLHEETDILFPRAIVEEGAAEARAALRAAERERDYDARWHPVR